MSYTKNHKNKGNKAIIITLYNLIYFQILDDVINCICISHHNYEIVNAYSIIYNANHSTYKQ